MTSVFTRQSHSFPEHCSHGIFFHSSLLAPLGCDLRHEYINHTCNWKLVSILLCLCQMLDAVYIIDLKVIIFLTVRKP